MPGNHRDALGLADREFHRILLVKPSSLGDIIHSLPVLSGLRFRYPNAHISWLVARPFASLIDSHPALNEIVVFDRKRFGSLGRNLGVTGDFLRFLKELRARSFDLTIDLQGLFRSGFFAQASGAPVRIGFADAREFASAFYTHKIPSAPTDTHAVDRNYAIAPLLGFTDHPIKTDLAITDSEDQTAKEILYQAGCNPQQRWAAIMPGARWETKRWPPSRFAALTGPLADQFGLQSVLLGAPDEKELCDEITGQAGRSVVNLAGQTSIRELAAIIQRTSLAICHDSGPMHIAAALGRPLICIVGPTNPMRTGPYQLPQAVLRRENLACSPCLLRRMGQCTHQHACMQEISVTHLLDRVKSVLRHE